jgi:DNA-binding transcriptional MerR regulator
MDHEAEETPLAEAEEPGSADKTYRSISEVAEMLQIRPHVLRYWETQFPMLRPKKGRSGSRMYRQREIELLQRIRTLLYDKGFTLKGARRRLRLETRKDVEESQLALGIENPWVEGLTRIREELEEIRRHLAQPAFPHGGTDREARAGRPS